MKITQGGCPPPDSSGPGAYATFLAPAVACLSMLRVCVLLHCSYCWCHIFAHFCEAVVIFLLTPNMIVSLVNLTAIVS